MKNPKKNGRKCDFLNAVLFYLFNYIKLWKSLGLRTSIKFGFVRYQKCWFMFAQLGDLPKRIPPSHYELGELATTFYSYNNNASDDIGIEFYLIRLDKYM